MKTRLLPIGASPIIGYLHHAFPLAILSQTDRYLPWFYSQYIQLHCPANLSDGPDPERKRKFNFYRLPYHDQHPAPGLQVSGLHRDVVLAEGSVIDFARRAIAGGMYVQVCVDEFELPGKAAYQKRHLLHEALIYGFCDQRAGMATLGFNARGDFAPLWVGYGDLSRAFDAGAVDNTYDPDGLRLFRLDEKTGWAFDLQCVVDGLEDYVASYNTSKRFGMFAPPIDGVFGMAAYTPLIETYTRLFDHAGWFDIRPIHILWEHKTCMLDRIRYLESTGYLDAADGFGNLYAQIEAHAGITRMMMLKLRVSKNLAILERILQRLAQLAEKERCILNEIYTQLTDKIVRI